MFHVFEFPTSPSTEFVCYYIRISSTLLIFWYVWCFKKSGSWLSFLFSLYFFKDIAIAFLLYIIKSKALAPSPCGEPIFVRNHSPIFPSKLTLYSTSFSNILIRCSSSFSSISFRSEFNLRYFSQLYQKLCSYQVEVD